MGIDTSQWRHAIGHMTCGRQKLTQSTDVGQQQPAPEPTQAEPPEPPELLKDRYRDAGTSHLFINVLSCTLY